MIKYIRRRYLNAATIKFIMHFYADNTDEFNPALWYKWKCLNEYLIHAQRRCHFSNTQCPIWKGTIFQVHKTIHVGNLMSVTPFWCRSRCVNALVRDLIGGYRKIRKAVDIWDIDCTWIKAFSWEFLAAKCSYVVHLRLQSTNLGTVLWPTTLFLTSTSWPSGGLRTLNGHQTVQLTQHTSHFIKFFKRIVHYRISTFAPSIPLRPPNHIKLHPRESRMKGWRKVIRLPGPCEGATMVWRGLKGFTREIAVQCCELTHILGRFRLFNLFAFTCTSSQSVINLTQPPPIGSKIGYPPQPPHPPQPPQDPQPP